MTNLRVGTFLELATTVGAIAGAAVAAYTNSFVHALWRPSWVVYSRLNAHDK